MAINPLGGRRFARTLQLTNGKAAKLVLKQRSSIGLDQRLGRRIRTGAQRIPIKPIGKVVRRPLSLTQAQPLTDAQLSVRTGRAGVGARSRTKIW